MESYAKYDKSLPLISISHKAMLIDLLPNVCIWHNNNVMPSKIILEITFIYISNKFVDSWNKKWPVNK